MNPARIVPRGSIAGLPALKYPTQPRRVRRYTSFLASAPWKLHPVQLG